ncbi:MAG: hypothetical protein HDT30_04375 [Clostridiales bacterium]|nr:hypothetical protein [Clostridiales bacterium]
MSNLADKMKNMLDELAYIVPVKASCGFVWGEVEMPECLRKELEESEKETDM